MTRIEAMTAFSALDTPALYAEMQRRGIASPDFDAACKWAEKVCDRIAKTSAATLATMTDWRQVLDHASGKDKPQRSADDLPADIVGTWYDVEFNAPPTACRSSSVAFPRSRRGRSSRMLVFTGPRPSNAGSVGSPERQSARPMTCPANWQRCICTDFLFFGRVYPADSISFIASYQYFFVSFQIFLAISRFLIPNSKK